MPLWKDDSLFDSSSKNASDAEPQPSSDIEKKDDEGVSKDSRFDDQERPANNTQDDNDVGHQYETKVDMSNITTTYPVSSTPNTRIHKDHSLAQVIGDIQSGVLTRGMTKTIIIKAVYSAVYEGKHQKTFILVPVCCFLSQENLNGLPKVLSDSAW
ncbi:hypothetical protein Tco_0347872 [Tanacetum coccineum]